MHDENVFITFEQPKHHYIKKYIISTNKDHELLKMVVSINQIMRWFNILSR